MSTRCQIGFYDSMEKDLEKYEALIYRHSDGYPEGVLPDIVPFLKEFSSDRGMTDIEYCSARLLQHLTNLYDAYAKNFLGYGISNSFHGDIEYFYAICSNGVINIYTSVVIIMNLMNITCWRQ